MWYLNKSQPKFADILFKDNFFLDFKRPKTSRETAASYQAMHESKLSGETQQGGKESNTVASVTSSS